MMLATGANIYFTFLNKSLTFVVFGLMSTSHLIYTHKKLVQSKKFRLFTCFLSALMHLLETFNTFLYS